MFSKSEKDAEIFVYDKMEPEVTNKILLSKVELFKKNFLLSNKIKQLQEDGAKLWLIRDSRIEGLLTVQSVTYDKTSSEWKQNQPARYMLSIHQGWIINNYSPHSPKFEETAVQAGGIIKMTDDNATPHLPGLLKLLSEQSYHSENRVNPKVGEETTAKAYTHYTPAEADIIGHMVKLQSAPIALPEGILIALSCPLTTKDTGEAKLMKDPVTLVSDGISYERENILAKNPGFLEGRDFYPNTKLKTIINYVSAISLKQEEYLAKLQKVNEDIMDPILLIVMETPVLSPSGISYEKESIEQWIKSKQGSLPTVSSIAPIEDPVTKLDIRGKHLPENVNLRQFIKFWPNFYEQLLEKFSSPKTLNM